MKKRIVIGLLLGLIAGTIDVVPMLIQKLPWAADASAFCMWVVIGFFIATSELRFNPVLKGILFSFVILLPSAIIIGGKGPFSLIPISFMTLVLGGLLGFSIQKIFGNITP
jgi:hypothetical protein